MKSVITAFAILCTSTMAHCAQLSLSAPAPEQTASPTAQEYHDLLTLACSYTTREIDNPLLPATVEN